MTEADKIAEKLGLEDMVEKQEGALIDSNDDSVEVEIDNTVTVGNEVLGAELTAVASTEYTGADITALDFPENVRVRPGMYIGSTDYRGLHHLAYEVIDNSIDEAMAGFCNKIGVTIHSDNSITVQDNGRGIPVDMHEKGKPTVEVVLTILHAGGKFGKKGGYKVSGGLHGVGVSVVNALSSHLTVTVQRDGKLYEIGFTRGITSSELREIGPAPDDSTGTTVHFLPDPDIFTVSVYQYDTLRKRIRELAFLNKGVSISLTDERTIDENGSFKQETFCYEGGIISYVDYLNQNKTLIHPSPIYFNGKKDDTIVEVALQYNDTDRENLHSFVNNINTEEGGTHAAGFRGAMTKLANDYARRHKILKEKDPNFESIDVQAGLAAIVSIKIPNPQFEGQTKTKLGNSEVRGIVSSIVVKGLGEYFEENPPVVKAILERMALAQRARIAAKKAREAVKKQNALEISALPGKLADCSLHDPTQSEIYLVEGDSAGGSAKSGRDRRFQAILPLRGKILNVEKARADKIFANNEICTMITAFGSGINDDFDLSKARYSKIIIMTDADVDGAHIRTLLLTFFYRHMKPLIENGRVYIARPPLFQIRKGRNHWYTYSDEEQEAKLDEVGREGITVQRYKGLGEMNPEQLWETTMDPATRIMMRVDMEDAEEADRLFTVLMGDKVEPRRQFIEENAKNANEIDA